MAKNEVIPAAESIRTIVESCLRKGFVYPIFLVSVDTKTGSLEYFRYLSNGSLDDEPEHLIIDTSYSPAGSRSFMLFFFDLQGNVLYDKRDARPELRSV